MSWPLALSCQAVVLSVFVYHAENMVLCVALGILVLVVAAVLFVVSLLGYFQPRWFMAVLKRLAPSVLWNFQTEARVAALTIDDAPMEQIDEILDVLRDHQVHATFFVIGSYAATEQGHTAVARMLAEGHEIGNHSWSNFPSVILSVLTAALFELDLTRTHALLTDLLDACQPTASGQTNMHWFRPSHGFFAPGMLTCLASFGYRCVLGDVYPFDPELRCVGLNTWRVKYGVHPGAIIILHDRPHTPATLRKLLPDLVGQGYTLGTLTQIERLCAQVPPAVQ